MFRTYFLVWSKYGPSASQREPEGRALCAQRRKIAFGVAYFYVLQLVKKVKSLKAESKQ